MFKEAYCNPESETFGNAYRSALAAGFSDEYASTITAPSKEVEWVAEIVRDYQMLSKAETVLKDTLEMDASEDVGKLRVKQDSAKFIAKTLGRHKYSERTETDLTSGGKPIAGSIQIVQPHEAASAGADVQADS